MSDIPTELERQTRANAKLLDLLRMIERTIPGGRAAQLREEAQRTADVLDDCRKMIDCRS